MAVNRCRISAVAVAVLASGCGGDTTLKTTALGTSSKPAAAPGYVAPSLSRATSGDRSISLYTDEPEQRLETNGPHATAKMGSRTIDIDFDKATIVGVDGDPITISKTVKNVEVESIKGALKIKVDGNVVLLKP